MGNRLHNRDRKAMNGYISFGNKNITKIYNAVHGIEEAARNSELIILAVPYEGAKEAVKEMKKAEEGKILVDVSNPMDKNWRWAKGFNESAAEELAKHAKGAKVVKAFNTIFAENMKTGQLGTRSLPRS